MVDSEEEIKEHTQADVTLALLPNGWVREDNGEEYDPAPLSLEKKGATPTKISPGNIQFPLWPGRHGSALYRPDMVPATGREMLETMDRRFYCEITPDALSLEMMQFCSKSCNHLCERRARAWAHGRLCTRSRDS